MAAELGCRLARTKSLVRREGTCSTWAVRLVSHVELRLPHSDMPLFWTATDIEAERLPVSRDLVIRLKARCYIVPSFACCIFLAGCYYVAS